jgi:hypothetical protein
MRTIADIRKEYPQYDDLSDEDLAKSLWQANYSDMDFGDFKSKIGVQSAGRYKGLDVVKQLDAGGMVLREPKAGRLLFIDEKSGFSSTDPKFVEQVMAGEDPAQISSQGYFEDVMRETDPSIAMRGKMVEGIPFAGSWADEMVGGILGEGPQANLRLRSKAMQEQNPVMSEVGKMAGSVAATAPLAVSAPAIPALQALPMGQKIMAGAGVGAGYGALEGGIYGAGDDQAARGAIGGAVGGALGGVAAPLIGQGIESIVMLANRTDVPNIARVLGVSNDAAKVIKDTLAEAGGSMRDAIRNIRKGGELGMIADSDTATQVLLDAAGAAGGRASTITAEAVRQRAKKEAGNLGGYMDEALSPLPKTQGGMQADVQDIAESISKTTQIPRQQAYDQAFNKPIDYSAEEGMAIESLMKRIPNSYLEPAIKRANERMQFAGQNNQQIMAEIAEDGSIVFTNPPNVQQLDEIKKALGEVAFNEVDNLGRSTPRAVDALKMYRELRNAIGNAVPEYNKAMDIASDKISLDNALDVGEKLLTNKIKPRDAARMLSGASESERNVAKLGSRSYISDVIDSVKATVASPDVDVNQLRKVLTELSSDASKKKLSVLLGTKETQTLYKNLERANAALALRAAVAANSKTAVRQRVQEQVKELTDAGALQTLLKGQPLGSSQKAIQALTGATDEYNVSQQKEIFKDVAKALTGIQGRKAKEAVVEVYKAINSQKATNEQIEKIIDALMGGISTATIMTGSKAGSELVKE